MGRLIAKRLTRLPYFGYVKEKETLQGSKQEILIEMKKRLQSGSFFALLHFDDFLTIF